MPRKQIPAPIEDLIPRLTLLISKGRLVRQVFIKQELARRLVAGEQVAPSDLRLFNVKDFNGVGPISSFLEVAHTQPLLANQDALGMPAYAGITYIGGFATPEQLAEVDKLVGQEFIFLIARLERFYANGVPQVFPSPQYQRVEDGHWREGLPLPITELQRVNAIAKAAGFVKPRNIVLSRSKG